MSEYADWNRFIDGHLQSAIRAALTGEDAIETQYGQTVVKVARDGVLIVRHTDTDGLEYETVGFRLVPVKQVWVGVDEDDDE